MIDRNKLNFIKKSVFLILLFFYAQSASATIFSHISLAQKGFDDVTYTYTIDDWTPDQDNQPNPCYGVQSCKLYVDHRHQSNGTSGGPDNNVSVVDITEALTVGDVRKKWLAEHPLPLSGKTSHYGEVLTNECVGLFYGTRRDDGFNNPLFPGSACGIAPPPTGHCQFSTNDIELDYGSTSPSALNGRRASATVTVSCDAPMKLEAWLINPDDGSDTVPLRADGSIKAKLMLDGESTAASGKTFSVTSGGSQALTVTSEAVVSGTPEAGEFSGSAVLFLSVP